MSDWLHNGGDTPPAGQTVPVGHRRGLTLIEVMLTMAILGIAGVVLVSATAQCLAVIRTTRLYNQAHTLLARVDLEHPLFDEDIQAGTERGRFSGSDFPSFEWERRIDVVGEEEDRLFEIRTRVSWTERGRRGYEEIVYYYYAPEEGG